MEKNEAIERLKELLPPGTTVYTVLRHVSSSGMTRWIDPLVLAEDEWSLGAVRPLYIAGMLSEAFPDDFDFKRDRRHDGIKRGGCGMDMGFDLVYSISRSLYPDGYKCIGEKCPANDHVNGDHDYTPGHVVHRDGGYALKHRWL